jgi:hypothetical protein
MVTKEKVIFPNRKSLTKTDLIEFLKYLNRKYVKIKNFEPEKLIEHIDENEIEFESKFFEEPYKQFIKLLEDRKMI